LVEPLFDEIHERRFGLLHGQAPGAVGGLGQRPVADDVGMRQRPQDLGLQQQPPRKVLLAQKPKRPTY